jgi:TPR repeat protein
MAFRPLNRLLTMRLQNPMPRVSLLAGGNMVDIRILKTIVFGAALALLLAMALIAPASAGFVEGNDAFRRAAYGEAAEHWRVAAENGDSASQHSLGYLYERGWGVKKDPAQARDWYRAAAEQGSADSMVNLGALYARGEGIERDLARAYTWFRLAALQGQMMAPFNIASIEMELTEADRMRSNHLAMAILPRLAANMDEEQKQQMRARITDFLASGTGRRTVAYLNSARRRSQYYESARNARGELPSLTAIETVGPGGATAQN